MRAVPSTLHQKLRFPTKDGVMEVNGDQVATKQCVLATAKRKASGKVNSTGIYDNYSRLGSGRRKYQTRRA
jgi:hypothetical protein